MAKRIGNGIVFRRLLFILPLLLAGTVCVMEGLEWFFRNSRPSAPAPALLSEKQPGPAQRVGTPGISMASLILVLGGRHKLAAITPEVRDNPWLMRIAPEVAGLPTPFSRLAGVNVEALLAAKADLVTLWLGNDALARRLEELGIAVLQMAYSTPEEMKTAVRRLGRALGARESERAEMLIGYYENNLRRVATALQGLPEEARPRVYYAAIAPLHTEGNKSMVNAWIDAAGGINVAARGGVQGDTQINLEELLAWDPEIIITLDAAQQGAILGDARWRNINAVRHGRVIVNPKGVNAWCTRAAEAALQVLWAAKTFHPERFGDVDMADETRRFYRQFYAYQLNDEELARVLRGLPPPAPTSSTPPRKRS